MIRVSGLFIYPVKSCRGIAVDRAELSDRGLLHDRRWQVVDSGGGFMTQRDWPAMARIAVGIGDDRLRLEAPGMPELELPITDEGEEREVRIWRDTVSARSQGAEAARWLSEILGTDCGLVRMPNATIRPVDPSFAGPEDRVGFADGFPFLLISEASLEELNRRLAEPLPMDRFRPNITVSGCSPHSEDGWSAIVMGDVGFRVVKPCARCVVTTTDQRSGERGPEPLRTLASYRRVGNQVLFGQNLVREGPGILQVGDPCRVEKSA